jgi:hypothetical protein
MDFNTTIDIIIKDLREAREIIDDLKQYPGVPQIQIELAKSKCKSAEEVIATLKTLKQEHKVEIIKQPVNKEPAEVPESIPQKKSNEKQAETNIIADRFSAMANTFNEQLGNIKSEGDISHAMKTKHLSNLTEAIGINDKFLFVREIFNGNQSSYNEAIAKLNKVENISDAKAIIMSYTGEGDGNEAVKELLDLVKRKLPADE